MSEAIFWVIAGAIIIGAIGIVGFLEIKQISWPLYSLSTATWGFGLGILLGTLNR